MNTTVSQFGLAVKHVTGKLMNLHLIRFWLSFLFKISGLWIPSGDFVTTVSKTPLCWLPYDFVATTSKTTLCWLPCDFVATVSKTQLCWLSMQPPEPSASSSGLWRLSTLSLIPVLAVGDKLVSSHPYPALIYDPLCVCVCVCVCVCMCVCMYVCVCVCACVLNLENLCI